MKNILFISQFKHDYLYFSRIRLWIAKHKRSEIKTYSLIIFPFFLLEFTFLLRPGAIHPDVMAEIIKFDLERKCAKYGQKKRWIFKILLSALAKLYFAKMIIKLQKRKYSTICMWNGHSIPKKAAAHIAKFHGIKICFFEHGSLPNTVTIDNLGINYESSVPREARFYKDLTIDENIPQAQKLDIRKNLSGNEYSPIDLPPKFVFVPFQVPLDTQILLHSPFHGMNDFFKILNRIAAKMTDPDLTLVIKEHPSARIHLEKANLHEKIIFANGNNTQELIEQSLAVLTINSSVGIEAMMFERKIISIGRALYTGFGLTYEAASENTLLYAINNIDTIEVDQDLRSKFLWYLKNSYLVPGNMKNVTEEHCAAITQRVI